MEPDGGQVLNLVTVGRAKDVGLLDSATVAIIVAVIALVGVLVAQTITLFNERAKRRDEQTKVVRDKVQEVMMAFYDYAEFARAATPKASSQQPCEPYDVEWDRVSGLYAAGVAHMAGRGKHRDAALNLIDGIGLQARAFRYGEHVGADPRVGYIQMAWAGFEIVAAWLRGDRMPRHSRRVSRAAARMRARIDAEYRWEALQGTEGHKSGVVRIVAGRIRFWIRRRWRRWVSEPARKAWNFLFAP